MVVIPTSEHVSLHYGRTPIDLIAIFLTLLGIAGVVWLARTPPLAFPAPKTRPESEDVPDDDPLVAAPVEWDTWEEWDSFGDDSWDGEPWDHEDSSENW
jgi:hypothetical protein